LIKQVFSYGHGSASVTAVQAVPDGWFPFMALLYFLVTVENAVLVTLITADGIHQLVVCGQHYKTFFLRHS